MNYFDAKYAQNKRKNRFELTVWNKGKYNL